MKKLILILLLIPTLAFSGQLGVTVYSGTTAQSPVKQGAKSVTFDLVGFSGTISNATFSNITLVLPAIMSGQDGDRLNDIPYTVTGGSLIIIDVR